MDKATEPEAGPDPEGTVEVPVQPTEDPAKVEAAVRNVFPEATLERSDWGLRGPTGSLARFTALVREQRIPDTVRGVLFKGMRTGGGGSTRFTLSKQAAAAGKLNVAAGEAPLGDLHVELRAASREALEAFVDRATPDTRAWSLEARGLTAKTLREQEQVETLLDALDVGPSPRRKGEAGGREDEDGEEGGGEGPEPDERGA